jgi:hypothetical protein
MSFGKAWDAGRHPVRHWRFAPNRALKRRVFRDSQSLDTRVSEVKRA